MNWIVQFVSNYAVVRTTVEAEDDEQALKEALSLMKEYHGWDLSTFDAEAEPEDDSEGGFGNESACDNCGDEWAELDARKLCDECAEVTDQIEATGETA